MTTHTPGTGTGTGQIADEAREAEHRRSKKEVESWLS
jgi:hypothetical protein